MSDLIEKGLPCDECGSSDNAALYDDGDGRTHTYCFGCKAVTRSGSVTSGERKAKPSKKNPSEVQAEIDTLLEGSMVRALPSWNLTQATCRHADYRVKAVGEDKGYHLAIYKDAQGVPCFVKVRVVSSENTKVDFFGVGDQSRVTLWGAETMGQGGPMIVVTEGEKDRLAALQLWSCKFPVVALPFGAESSGEAFARALDKLNRYEKVVLALDMDRPGREGAIELAKMLPPGKAFIADFPSKDLHETVQQQGPEVAKRALFNAAPYRPDGIVDADDLDASLLQPTEWGAKLPYDFLYKWTYGLAPGDVWVLGAGTGIGKSDLAAEIVATHISPSEDGGSYKRAAVFNYEAGPQSTLRLILGKLWSKRFNIPDPEDGSENVYWTRPQLEAAMAYRRERCAKVYINDHKGAISWTSVKERLRYLRHAEGITLGVVDPVAAMVAGAEDERKALDLLFAEAKALAEELGITLIFVSHLTRPKDGKSHEEGGRAELRHFRGSGAITMWASFVIALERNQQGDEDERKVTTLRMLKDRKTGDSTGMTRSLVYNTINGRLEEYVTPLEKAQAQDDAEPAPPPLSSSQSPEA